NIPIEIHAVSDGLLATQFLKQKGDYSAAIKPDIILLDLNLPKINGLEVLKMVKTDPILKSIPVIILSTSSAQLDIASAYQLNANSFISKPIDYEEFMNVMQMIYDYWFKLVQFVR
ncbi:UNVERIFIED_CONTAM: hypothetical protein GTU68_031043, partial [Idotea baltica]|nr:hypothetical protein [Idotea baltica]